MTLSFLTSLVYIGKYEDIKVLVRLLATLFSKQSKILANPTLESNISVVVELIGA